MANNIDTKRYEFFNEFIDSSCHKQEFTYDEYRLVRDNHDCVWVRVTVMYDLYRVLVDAYCTRSEFNNMFKDLLYYDKYVCDHGIEYYYLVVFNKTNKFYNTNKALIDALIDVNGPATWQDFHTVIPAVSE